MCRFTDSIKVSQEFVENKVIAKDKPHIFKLNTTDLKKMHGQVFYFYV